MVNKDKAKELLGQNLSNSVVATALGCDESYISQLLSDETFRADVTLMRAEALQAASKRDGKADAIEDKLLDMLTAAVEDNLIYKPADILRTYAVLNAAKRRGVSAPEALTINNQIVNLTIPPVVVQNFTLSSTGEVVEVEGQTLVTMPAHQLLKNLISKKGERGENNGSYEKAAKYIPQTEFLPAR